MKYGAFRIRFGPAACHGSLSKKSPIRSSGRARCVTRPRRSFPRSQLLSPGRPHSSRARLLGTEGSPIAVFDFFGRKKIILKTGKNALSRNFLPLGTAHHKSFPFLFSDPIFLTLIMAITRPINEVRKIGSEKSIEIRTPLIKANARRNFHLPTARFRLYSEETSNEQNCRH